MAVARPTTGTVTKLRVIYVGWGERWLLGTLAQVGQRLLFEYSAEAVAQATRRGWEPSPLRVPVPRAYAQAAGYEGPRHFYGLPGFVADALPDGWGMLLMDRAFRKAGREPASVSVLERLAVVGHSAMGALAFEPVDPLEADQLGVLSLRQLAQEAHAVLADDAEHTPQAQLQRLMRLGGSPQGARPKALLRWHTPSDVLQPDDAGAAAGGSWLVKFPAQREKPDVCAVEELYARLARQGGMDMPDSRFIPLGRQHAAFAVRRFDRATVQSPQGPQSLNEVRVPMLSMAALLDADFRLPALDYETVLLATQRLTASYGETLKAFERCVFNVLTHNRDDHAKNFAFVLGRDDRWHLSPAFDLTFSFGPGGEHSTSVAGEGRLPTRMHLLKVARGGGLKAKDAERVIDHWVDALQPAPQLLRDLPISAATTQSMLTSMQPVWLAVQQRGD
jgi:serine/threonine-protein kinase HipA